MWMASAEYSIPIIEMLRFAAFYDVGTVNLTDWNFDPSGYADNWGLGVRLNIPQMGPIRLDYGFPIHYPDYLDGDPQFQFSIGWNRPI
jgi:outer membrane protein assembly factor BamA